MARSVNSFVGSLERSLERTGTTKTKRKLATVISSCGWKKRSAARLQELNDALAHAGIYSDQDLLDLYLGVDTFVWFSRRPPLPRGQIFYQERAAGYHIGKYREVLERALPQYRQLVHKSGGNLKEKAYVVDGRKFIPDLVFRSGRSGPWIVCEIERGDPKWESVPQLIDYMRAAAREPGVVGVLITARPRTRHLISSTRDLLDAVPESVGPVHWLWYDVSVTLQPAEIP